MLVEPLFIAGAIATGVCFARGYRNPGLIGVLAALAMVGLYIGAIWVIPLYFAAAGLGLVYVGGMVIFLATRPRVDASQVAPITSGERMKRAFIGGLIGIVPGALVVAVPTLLLAVGVISADASQIAFLGIFLAPVGLIAGVLVGALTSSSHQSSSEQSGSSPSIGVKEDQGASRR